MYYYNYYFQAEFLKIILNDLKNYFTPVKYKKQYPRKMVYGLIRVLVLGLGFGDLHPSELLAFWFHAERL